MMVDWTRMRLWTNLFTQTISNARYVQEEITQGTENMIPDLAEFK